MPLESRETSVLWPDERMRRRGLIKQMTKKERDWVKRSGERHMLDFMQNVAGQTKPFAQMSFRGLGGRGGGVVWSPFKMCAAR